MASFHYPHELAKHIRGMAPKIRRSIRAERLRELVEIAYFASMKTEESHGITCTLALVDYKKPDKPPPRIRPQRGSFVRLDTEFPLSVKTLAKLAQAADPAATCIAVAVNATGQLMIVGLIDQETNHRRAIRHEIEGRFGRLGILQIEVTGVGILSVFADDVLIAGLRQQTLATNFIDALRAGPISANLAPHIEAFRSKVTRVAGDDYHRTCDWAYDGWDELVAELWLGTLSRILLGIQRYGHGGALLLLPKYAKRHLNVKYGLDYPKLEEVMVQDAVSNICRRVAWWDVHDHVENGGQSLDPDLYFKETIATNDRDDALKAEVGAVHFVASLSRVDGLILMAPGLRVRGFGVEITSKTDPKSVYAAPDPHARVAGLDRVAVNHFGTRHRSMMRYCDQHPGSIGFVISQDGDVRAITKVKGRLVLWENVRLQNLESASSDVGHAKLRHR